MSSPEATDDRSMRVVGFGSEEGQAAEVTVAESVRSESFAQPLAAIDDTARAQVAGFTATTDTFGVAVPAPPGFTTPPRFDTSGAADLLAAHPTYDDEAIPSYGAADPLAAHPTYDDEAIPSYTLVDAFQDHQVRPCDRGRSHGRVDVRPRDGHERREGCNQRVRGSRRSRAGPDDSDGDHDRGVVVPALSGRGPEVGRWGARPAPRAVDTHRAARWARGRRARAQGRACAPRAGSGVSGDWRLRQLSLDPLELEALSDKFAVDRARVYEAANLGHLERVEVEAHVRALIAERNRRPRT